MKAKQPEQRVPQNDATNPAAKNGDANADGDAGRSHAPAPVVVVVAGTAVQSEPRPVATVEKEPAAGGLCT